MNLLARAGIVVGLLLLSCTFVYADGGVTVGNLRLLEIQIAAARTTTVVAYSLTPHNGITRALALSCISGGSVYVLLSEKTIGSAEASNRETKEFLEGSSPRCKVHFSPRPLHLKMAVVDGSLFLSDTNFSRRGLVLRDDRTADRDIAAQTLRGNATSNGQFSTLKAESLRIEAGVLLAASGAISIQTESFGRGNPVSDALDRAAGRMPIRLIVSANEARGSARLTERDYLHELQSKGVQVRLGMDNEKILVTGSGAWVGSSNATSGSLKQGSNDQVDWGLSTADPTLSAQLRSRFEVNWQRAEPFSG